MAEVDLNELERYLRIYQENPDSRVFAPLADMYRRLAKYREAEQICREGLQRHPYYAGGKVALAYVLLDTGRLDEAHREVEEVVTYYPDNLLARKILIRVLAGLGQLDRAQREFEALKQLSPQVISDPDLESALRRAYQQPTHLDDRPLPRRPVSPLRPEGSENVEKNQKLKLLKAKKRILETWIRRLGSERTLG